MHNAGKRRRSGPAIAGRLIGLVKPMLPLMLGAVLMGVAGYLCAIFIPVVGGYALLDIAGFAAAAPLRWLFAALLTMALLRGVLRYGEQALNHYIAFKLLAMIRDRVFRTLRRLAPAKLEVRDRGNLISMITTDIELLEVFYAHTLSPVVIAILTSALMAAFLGRIHWALAAVALVGYGVVGILIPLAISRLGRNTGAAYREGSGALGSAVLEGLRGLQALLQYRQGDAYLSKLNAQTDALGQQQAAMKRYEGLTSALCNAAILLCSLGSLATGIHLYQAGLIGFAGLTVAFVAQISSFGPVVALASLSNNLLQTFAAADRVLDILDETPVVDEVVHGADVAFGGMAASRIRFAYGDEAILDGFDLDIRPRQILGVQGKSGSGKSTLLRLLMRFFDVDKGSVTMSGQNVRGINTESLRRSQGFVTQETVLFHDTIEANIRIAKLSATRAEVEAACHKASIHAFIQSLPQGYDTNVGELGDRLSGGESASALAWPAPFCTMRRCCCWTSPQPTWTA